MSINLIIITITMLAINNFAMLLIRSVEVPCHYDIRNVEYFLKSKPRSNYWRKPGTFVHLWRMTFVPLPPADTVSEVSRCYVTLNLHTDNSFTVFTMLRLFRSSFQYRNQSRRKAWFLVAGHSLICMLLLRFPSFPLNQY
jgi:hypothetical protein